MSAVNTVCQPKFRLVHLATDASQYRRDGTITGFVTKSAVIGNWPAVIGARGNAAAIMLFIQDVAPLFGSFDEAIENIEHVLPEIVSEWQELGFTHSEITLAGHSERRARPEAYVVYTHDQAPPGLTDDEYRASETYAPPCLPRLLPDIVTGPCGEEIVMQIRASEYKKPSIDEAPEVIAWDLHKQLEMQRQTAWSGGGYVVGGFGHLTTLAADGSYSERVLVRWDEDFERIGQKLAPTRIDWRRWHLANPRPGEAPMSRLRRQMLERKLAKTTRAASGVLGHCNVRFAPNSL